MRYEEGMDWDDSGKAFRLLNTLTNEGQQQKKSHVFEDLAISLRTKRLYLPMEKVLL